MCDSWEVKQTEHLLSMVQGEKHQTPCAHQHSYVKEQAHGTKPQPLTATVDRITIAALFKRILLHRCHHHHHHHQITKLSHSINAIGPAPHRSGKNREHRSIVFATITHIPSLHKIRRNAPRYHPTNPLATPNIIRNKQD
jgi:hypothetical protein